MAGKLKGRGELADNVDPAPPFKGMPGPGQPVAPTGLLGPGPLTYAMAAIMLSVAVLAAWTWSVPRNGATAAMGRQAALRDNAAQEPGRRGAAGGRGFVEAPIVGTITQMADCRWADRAAAPAAGSYVGVGQKFVLSTGGWKSPIGPARRENYASGAGGLRSELREQRFPVVGPGDRAHHATGHRHSVGMHRFVEGTLFSVVSPCACWSIAGGSSPC